MSQNNHPLDNRLPDLLRSGKRLRGIFNGLPSPAIVEMCAYAGFTFVIIDNEHGAADFETTEHMLRAARGSGIILFHDIHQRTVDMLPLFLEELKARGYSVVRLAPKNDSVFGRSVITAQAQRDGEAL